MPTLKRVVRAFAASALVFPLVALGGAYLYLRTGLPPASGGIEVPGLLAPVEVIRDRWAVPHLYAANEDDLFFAQGYVQAQDRLWQMELYRRAARGTLAEVLGERALASDRLARTLGFGREAAAEWSRLEPEARRPLEAYAEGVNAYLATHGRQLPIEFILLDLAPAPWRPEDTLAVGRLLAWSMDSGWRTELLLARLVRAVGPERAAELAGEEAIPVPGELGSLAALEQPVLLEEVGQEWPWVSEIGGRGWVVDGRKAASGRPLMAADLCSGAQMPSLWYEMHLVGGRYDVVGASVPGLPGIVVGRNRSIAWAWGGSAVDNVDLYVERVRHALVVQARQPDRWADMRVSEEQLRVRGRADPVRLYMAATRHGPLITPLWPGEHDQLALCWAGAGQPSAFGRSLLALNRASDWEEFRAALRGWTVPAQTFLYADVAGNTGYVVAGLAPVRKQGDGGFVAPGWLASYDWAGFSRPELLPSALNPGQPIICIGGSPDSDPQAGTADSPAEARAAARASSLLSSRQSLETDDALAIQTDLYGPTQPLLSLLLASPPGDWIQQRALPCLRYWDLRYDAESAGAGIFEVFYWRLVHNTLDDELGPDLVESYLERGAWHRAVMEELGRQPASPWYDDVRTEGREDRDRVVSQSLAEAMEWLGRRFGDLPHEWNWGRVHSVTFRHPLGSGWPLSNLLNRGAMRASGAPGCLNATGSAYEDRMVVSTLPAYRLVVDLGGSGQALATLATGQSGNPVSRHYADMITPWREGRYHPLLYERQAILEASQGMLNLVPPS
ncbi:MAG: penicillin acylase family protein [Anaerolineae bacterium]|nr:penicillin acylase family protein [Anaerolineae bacterium]